MADKTMKMRILIIMAIIISMFLVSCAPPKTGRVYPPPSEEPAETPEEPAGTQEEPAGTQEEPAGTSEEPEASLEVPEASATPKCDSDCSKLNKLYCEGDIAKFDRGVCTPAGTCKVETSSYDCNTDDREYCDRNLDIWVDDYYCAEAEGRCKLQLVLAEECNDNNECTEDSCVKTSSTTIECKNIDKPDGTIVKGLLGGLVLGLGVESRCCGGEVTKKDDDKNCGVCYRDCTLSSTGELTGLTCVAKGLEWFEEEDFFCEICDYYEDNLYDCNGDFVGNSHCEESFQVCRLNPPPSSTVVCEANTKWTASRAFEQWSQRQLSRLIDAGLDPMTWLTLYNFWRSENPTHVSCSNADIPLPQGPGPGPGP